MLNGLREISGDQARAGRKALRKGDWDSFVISEAYFEGPIKVLKISGYTVRLLFNWASCTCKSFKYGKGDACKHIAIVFPKLCDSCRCEVEAHGECGRCKIENAVYMKETVRKKAEFVGGIRIN